MDAFKKVDQHTKLTLYNWGVACYKVARAVEAKSYFERAIDMDPNFEHAKHALETLNRNFNDPDKLAASAPEPEVPTMPTPTDKIVYEPKLKYADIVAKKNLPANFDKFNKPKYLSDEEFESLFKMTKDEFYKLPEWKRLRQKKAVKLW